MEIASLFAKISADVSDFSKGMSKMKDELSAQERGIQGLQSAVGTGLKVAAGLGVAAIGGLAAGIGVAVQKAADMEQGIQNIAASMQLGSEETAQLKDLIMDLGLDPKLKVTAVEAAQAIEVLGTAGLTMDEILQGAARSTVLLANSTGADFANAGAIATDVMAQFNIKAGDMAAAVDQITGVTVASKFTIEDYQLALAQAGGVAGSVGVEFEDFNAVIAATSPSFASGSDAGTSFKTFLQRLVPQTDKAKEALIKLGLSTGEDVVTAFFDAGGAMRPMEEISENLQNAFAGLSEAQKIEAASTIFGTDAMRTALALAEGGGEIIAEMKKIIGDTSAEKSAATRMDSLRGSWEIMTGVAETLTLGIGDKFIPVVRKAIDWLTSLAQKYGPMVIDNLGELAAKVETVTDWLLEAANTGKILNDKFAGLPRPIQDTINAAAAFVDTVERVVDWVGKTIGQFADWKDILAAVSVVIASIVVPAIGAFLAIAAPATAIFAGLVAASALLRNAWENDWLGIRTTIINAWDIVTGVFNSVVIKVGWIVDTFRSQWKVLSDTNASLGDKLALVWNTIKDVAGAAWQGVVTAVQILLSPFIATLKQWGDAAWSEFGERFPQTARTLESTFETAKTNITRFMGDLGAEFAPLGQTIQTFGRDALGEIVAWATGNETEFTATKEIWRSAKETFEVVAANVGTKLTEWGGKLKEWGDVAWQEFAQRFPQTAATLATAFETAKTNVTTALDYVGNRFGPLGNTIQTFGMGALREIGAWVTGSETDFESVNKIVDHTKIVFGQMWDDFSERFPATAKVVDDAWVAVSNATKTATDYASEKTAGLVTAIADFGLQSLAEIAKWATGTETEFTATTAIWKEFGLMAGDVGGDIMTALAPVGKWLAETLPQSAKATTESLEQLEQAWRDLTGQTEESAKTSEKQLGGLMGVIGTLIDSGLAIALSRVSTFVANFGQMFVALRAASTGDWEGMWAAIATIQKNSDAQTLREAQITVDALVGVMETGGEDVVEGFNRGVRNSIPRTTTTMTEFANRVGGTVMQELQMDSPSKLFERFGGWTIEGFVGGINSALPSVGVALNGLTASMSGAMTTLVDNVGSTMHSAFNSIIEGVRYGVGQVNLATADVIRQSQQAEAAARHAWEMAKVAAASIPIPQPPTTPTVPPPVTTPPPPIGDGRGGYTGGAATTFGGRDIMSGLIDLTGNPDLFDWAFQLQDLDTVLAQLQQFGEHALMNLQAVGQVQGSSAEYLAYQALTGSGTETSSVNRILDAVHTLITTLQDRGAGVAFNIDMAPDVTLEQRMELIAAVRYLHEQYG